MTYLYRVQLSQCTHIGTRISASSSSAELYADSEDEVRAMCAEEWPDDTVGEISILEANCNDE